MTDSTFDVAVELVLKNEGGYVNDPHDPGGETNYGISKRSYPKLDIRHLTRETAIDIYRRNYWIRNRYAELHSASLAVKAFDFSVNMGSTRANMMLQEAYNDLVCHASRIKYDGVIGPISLAAFNEYPEPRLLLATYRLRAIRYYLDLQKSRYIAGWVRRAIS